MGLVALRYMKSFPTRDRSRVPCMGRWILYHWTTRKVLQCSQGRISWPQEHQQLQAYVSEARNVSERRVNSSNWVSVGLGLYSQPCSHHCGWWDIIVFVCMTWKLKRHSTPEKNHWKQRQIPDLPTSRCPILDLSSVSAPLGSILSGQASSLRLE